MSKTKGEVVPNVEAVLGVASLGEQDSSKESFLVESLFSEVSFLAHFVEVITKSCLLLLLCFSMQGKIELDLISMVGSMSFVGDLITFGEDGALGIEIMEKRDWF